jgi:hypothetical protein
MDFWAGLHTSDLKTEFVYWEWQLHSLAPEPLIGWSLEAGEPVEPVASEVLRVFHGYGWPAIQAALDTPGYPRDAAVRWARTFPKTPQAAATEDEDVQVRWVARYAFRLAGAPELHRCGQTGAAPTSTASMIIGDSAGPLLPPSVRLRDRAGPPSTAPGLSGRRRQATGEPGVPGGAGFAGPARSRSLRATRPGRV